MRRAFLAPFTICALAGAGALFLKPSPADRFDAALERLPAAEARARLDRLFAEGELTPRLMLRRADLALAAGDHATAAAMLEALEAQPDHAAVAMRRLVDLEIARGDPVAAIRSLEALQAAEPQPERLAQLVLWARLLRDGREAALLRAIPPDRLSPLQAERLVQLLRVGGDRDALQSLLEALAERPGPSASVHRRRLAELRIAAGEAEAVAAGALRRYGDDLDAAALAAVVDRLLDSEARRHGDALVDQAAAGRPEAAPALADALIAVGRPETAARALMVYAAAGPSYGPGQIALLESCKRLSDFAPVRRMLRGAEPGDIEPVAMGRIAVALALRDGPATLLGLRAHLTENVLDRSPAAAAAWALAREQPAAAIASLAEAAAAGGDPADWPADWKALAALIDEPGLAAAALQARDASARR
jgi:hypothetical protein